VITLAKYDRLARTLEMLQDLLVQERAESLELVNVQLGPVLAYAADALGLPEGWEVADLCDRIFELKERAAEQVDLGFGAVSDD
jgi:hypothetical protein